MGVVMNNYDDDEVAKKRKTIDRSCWKDLPNGPLIEIARRMLNFEDFEAMYFVCSGWTCVLRESQCKFGGHVGQCGPLLPWLMMAQQQGVETRPGSNISLRPCSNKLKAERLLFYSFSFRRVRELVSPLPRELEQANFDNCSLYSSRGWLLVVRKGVSMGLYNPFCDPSHNYIPLPGLDTLTIIGVHRFALSADPCSKSYTVMITYDAYNVGFWRPGDKGWTRVECFTFLSGDLRCFMLDVTFYRGYYYVVDRLKGIYRFTSPEHMGHCVDANDIRFHKLGRLPPGINGFRPNYSYLWRAYFVVESSSNKNEERLLVVVRGGTHPSCLLSDSWTSEYLTAGFRVVEIVVSPRSQDIELKEVASLGNKSLFVGRNQGFVVEVPQEDDNPCGSNASRRYYGCKPNCIYFTDDRYTSIPVTAECGKGRDMGVFNMADRSIERHFQGLSLDDYSPMLWIEPRC